jgi:hypothetical protein
LCSALLTPALSLSLSLSVVSWQGAAEATQAFDLARDRAAARRALPQLPAPAASSPAAPTTPLDPTLRGCFLKVAQQRTRVAAASAALAGAFPARGDHRPGNPAQAANVGAYRAAWGARTFG